MPEILSTQEKALVELGRALRARDYRFVTPTPETHRRVNARPANSVARTLADVFGWSRPFPEALLPPEIADLLARAEAVAQDGAISRSLVRFSSLDGALYVHSAYPTVAADSVFFGPDTYRFACLIGETLRRHSLGAAAHIVDIGCGSGAGGLVAARDLAAAGRAPGRLDLADINSRCLSFARVNAALGGVEATTAESDVLAGIEGSPDLVLANPPYLADPAHRLYRDGGGEFGAELSLRILREALGRLAPGGLLILYTGTAVVAGEDSFLRAASSLLAAPRVGAWQYAEIDPDVFGEELDQPAYCRADRIAAVGLVVET